MKKILIVGGGGYIGGYMTDYFQSQANYYTAVYDNLLFESRFLKKCNFIYGDIRDTDKLAKLLPGYDTVVWLAAIVGDGACAVNPTLTDEINYKSVKWLVDNYKGMIVFMSTCSVYGMNNDLIDETATPNPLSIYASTKLLAEQYITQNAKDYLIFRLGTLYGLSDEHSRLRFDLVANILTLRAVNEQPLTVFGGEQWRPLLHVRDVTHATAYCLDHDIKGLFNLSERNIVIADLAKTIKKIIPDTQISYEDIKFEDQRNYHVKNNKIFATGWRPKYTLEEGIYEMKNVFEEHRIKDINDPVYSNVAYMKVLEEASYGRD